ncbi:hypothetical protein AHAS_Ahas15G0236800 [Arachis hypogaea]
MMYYAISFEEFRKVSRCKTSKRDKLQITHEGTQQVKKTRIDILRKEYEMFSMKERKIIDKMFERFLIIINSLDSVGVTHTKPVLLRKLVRELWLMTDSTYFVVIIEVSILLQ